MYHTYFVSVITTIEKLFQIQSKITGKWSVINPLVFIELYHRLQLKKNSDDDIQPITLEISRRNIKLNYSESVHGQDC